ncbi:ABC transporter ATP-binding protein [Propionibacterium australiense]|uniref:ABC transporter n=1 Tax=Propionibacterium australiense TaxID=119981 RepID=A0A383S8F6_9ACTN|nr:ABC transporter ATP-binding protein [Propionibacterium australiense]RLP09550.1 ATP-binding cassette domain-containing protein [Propionibacterium australiense]RLP09873.1 ATP-binding cassette domain-containing protein [Propionibacterium australiense]SYZ34197.1 ABC transporter [Propionibacterium australiense]VEH89453.1 Aliphatic sulfonates import ATP-binding protein SsuB [Propionibacterium australiense]
MVNTTAEQYSAQPGPDTTGGGAVDTLHVVQVFVSHRKPLPVLDDVSVSIEPGRFVSLVGPSGCGKSTLLRLIAGLDTPIRGEIYADGHPVDGPDPSRGVVFQDPTLLPWLTVEQNIGLGPRVRGVAEREEERGRVDEMIEMVGLGGFRTAYPSELSGGMAQRAALARALVNRPRILLLDEPLGKLDALTRSTLQRDIVGLWQAQGFTGIMVTHDVEEALLLSDRVVIFSPRPARVIADLAVELDRPRAQDDPRFRELRRQILGLLGQ